MGSPEIADAIGECGATPFLDEADIDAGEEFEDRIRDFLNQAHEVVVLLTPWALERPYVWAELGVAWGRGIPIVGLLHGLTPAELQARPGTPVFLRSRNLLDINDFTLYRDQLQGRVDAKRGGR